MPTAPAIPEKTEEEKLEEASSSINNAFSTFSSQFGGDTTAEITKSEVVVNENATAPVMDISSAFSFFSGDTSNAKIYVATAPVEIEKPEEGEAAEVATAAQADSIFASMFSGGFDMSMFGF